MKNFKFSPKLTEADYRRAIELLEKGKTLSIVADLLGVTQQALGKGLKKRGYVLKHKRDIPKGQQKEILKLYKDGEKISAIREKLGLTNDKLKNFLISQGVYNPYRAHVCANVSLEEAIEWVKSFHLKHKRNPKANDWNRERGTPSATGLIKKFNLKWNDLILQAGLQPTIQYDAWDKNKVKAVFLKLYKKKEILPFRESFVSHPDLPSRHLVNKFFGTWANFLKDCNLEFIEEHYLWYQWEKCCEQIAKLKYRKIITQSLDTHVKGRPDIIVPEKKLIIDAMQSDYLNPQKLDEIKRYGSGYQIEFWCLFKLGTQHPGVTYRFADELILTKGIDRQTVRIVKELKSKLYSEEFKQKLLDDLRRACEKADEAIKARELSSHGLPTWRVYKQHFGSYKIALDLIGWMEKRNRYSDDDLIEILRKVFRNQEGPIQRSAFIALKNPGRDTYMKRFGSMDEACRRAGFRVAKLR